MSAIRNAFGKATIAGVAALTLIGTLCYLAVVGAVDPGQFLAAVVAGPVGYLYGRQSSN